jgi:hypothetical protein
MWPCKNLEYMLRIANNDSLQIEGQECVPVLPLTIVHKSSGHMPLPGESSANSGNVAGSNFIGAIMNLKPILLLSLIIVSMAPTPALAQAWSGIITPTRAANWQRANVGVPGGIPTNWTQCGSTIAAYTGSSSTINAAIAACGANHFVLLGPGTFNLSDGINFGGKSRVVLRGSGPNNTTLAFAGSSNCIAGAENICMVGQSPIYAGGTNTEPPCGGSGSTNCANWTAGFSQGATSITLANVGASGISNGDVIILDQANQATDNGGYFVCDTLSPTVCHLSVETGGTGNGRVLNGKNAQQEQYVTVTSGCSNSCVGGGPFNLTISPGLYANDWNRTGVNADIGVWWAKNSFQQGVENLTIDNSIAGARGNIGIYNCFECWVKNVRSIGGGRNHIWNFQSSRTEIRDSYFYGSRGSNQSYGIEPGEPAGSDQLFENNIFQGIASPIIAGGGWSGAVISYNFSINNVYATGNFSQGSYSSHDAGDSFNLFEGNQFNQLICDAIHGTPGGADTYFRNRLPGQESQQGVLPLQQTMPIDLDAYCRGFNIIGNVMGTPGYHTNYEAVPPVQPAQAPCNQSIYTLGWGGGECSHDGSSGVLDDPVVKTTLMRWGNYDTVTGTVRFDSAESSPGAVPFISAQTTPASHALPASFYMSSKPAFWGSMPFPAIGPDVTGGTGPGGFAYLNPAANCYHNIIRGSADGTGSAVSFDANNCYYVPTGPTPVAPTNLTVVVQ